MAKKRVVIKIFGIVQGVGFRPFIHKLVNEYGFNGWVQNSMSGVTIDIEGEEGDLKKFISDIPGKAPDLSVIEDIKTEQGELKNYRGFEIIKSDRDEEGFVLVSPDVSICSDCYNELTDPKNKRYRYPFINCTNCGPRFTIIKDIPYDRDKTTMSKFPMCHECDEEYHNIENRRYHAQPNCCPQCGPGLWLCDGEGREAQGDPIKCSAEKIHQGYIVAIKGLGGFHLACNALNGDTVRKLRNRKHRDDKPFAIMCRDVDAIKKYAHVSDDEQKILESPKRPIVLLRKRTDCAIPDEIAPDTNYLGFMLPYTPLHYLIFEDGIVETVIMTSANISDNPVIYKNDEAVKLLKDIADYFLLHNRDINTRCDDSVLKVIEGREYFIRRSRGYAPFPIKMDIDLKPILACGAEQKASFSISKDKYIFISQHIGDLKNYETLRHYEEQIEHFKKLFKIEPKIIACDLHPDYLSTNYAQEKYGGLDIVKVQHHHAHMVSCMADNCLHDDVIGITWDGTGYGTDGTIWGGEILVGNYSWFQRKGTFLSTAMPGGDRAVKDVYSMALSYMIKTFGADYKKYINLLPFPEGNERNMDLIYRMVDKKINSPVTTSCGRLFDGVSGMLGLCSIAGYEGQGAVRLEAAARANTGTVLKYDVYMQNGMYIFDWRGTIDNIIELLKQNADISFIASAFHNTVVDAAVSQVSLIREDTGINKVVLSGGVFQNNLILLKLKEKLREVKFDVYIHRRVSANDEGISVGQLIAAQNGGDYNVSCGTVKNNINR